jgi:anti-sigma regulatory factor (Ser/Thr protein kinase)
LNTSAARDPGERARGDVAAAIPARDRSVGALPLSTPSEVASRMTRVEELRDGIELGGVVVYERIVPATAAILATLRGELGQVLARLNVPAARRADIALVVTEAATNAVLHAYHARVSGPLYAAATLSGDTVTTTIADHGRGLVARTDSPGLGVGMSVMATLTDRLQITANPCGRGTRVVATFEHAATPAASWPHPDTPPAIRRAQLLCDYARELITASAGLHDDAHAVLAEARQTLARTAILRRRDTRA